MLLFVLSCGKKDSTLSSFALNNKKIEDSNENLSIKNNSFLEAIYIQADKNDDLIERKAMANQIHAIGADLYNYIEDLKIAIKRKNTTEYVNELFFNGDDITKEGNEFLMYIDNYKQSMSTVLENQNPIIVGMVNTNFDLSVIEDRRGIKTNWLTLNFRDLSPIISIIKLSTMQSDIRRIETQYFAELLGVKLNIPIRKTANNNIKEETDKLIGENSNKDLDEETDKLIGENSNKGLDEEKDLVDKETPKVDKVIVKEPKSVVKVKKEPIKITPKTIVNSTKKTHTVKPGENLYRISLKYKMTAEKIKKLNRMKNNNIVVGQVLKLE